MFGIRNTLRLGALVFGLSALLLLVIPGDFLSLLSLSSSDEPLQWSMRMIGVTLMALAGNMWANSQSESMERVRFVGIVMAICATGLGILTLLIPVELSWFTAAYAAVGFGFGANYLVCLIRRKY
jgi:hypothetical protein